MKKIEFFYECDFHYLKKTFKIMRITVFLLIVSILQTFANDTYSQSTRLSLDFSNTKLVDVMDQIEELSEFYFLFNEKLIETDREVSMSVNNQRIDKILDKLFSETDVIYTITDRKIILAPSFLSEGDQQQKTISGIVTDENGQVLPGVTAVIKGTTQGTVTNTDGNYSISNIPENATLVFSFVGMRTQEIVVGNQTAINVTMQTDFIGLDEVIAIGYGTIKKSDLTGAVQRVDVEKFEGQTATNLLELLNGTVVGLNSNQGNSASGGGTMEIRGQTSLKASNSPLVVLDGVIYNGSIGDINPYDIESIDVLKDASSAAIFGARSASGVIIVTTKRGTQVEPTINFSTKLGVIGLTNKMRPLGPEEYINARSENNSQTNPDKPEHYYGDPNDLPDGLTLEEWMDYDATPSDDPVDMWLNRLNLSNTEKLNYVNNKTVDWFDEVLQNGVRQDYNFSISGGLPNLKYYFSANYTDNKGYILGDEYKIFRSRANIDTKLGDYLNININLNFSDRDNGKQAASLTNAYRASPYGEIYDETGKVGWYSHEDETAQNPLMYYTYKEIFSKSQTLFSTISGDLKLPFGFSYRVAFVNRYKWDKNYSFDPVETLNGNNKNGYGKRNNSSVYEWMVDNLIKWNKTFNDTHTFDFTFLINAEKKQTWFDSQSNSEFFPSDALSFHALQAGINPALSNNDTYSTGNALMARLNYSLMNKYLLTATWRRDGYSAFGQKHPYATFPSLALGWRISEEEFFKAENIDNLKLRLSWGKNGNRAIGIYEALSQLATTQYIYGNQLATGAYTSTMANDDLRWETTTASNIGLDFGFFKNKVNGSMDIYFMKTNDLLMDRSLPSIIGYSSVAANLGEVQNKGFEMTINTQNINRANFNWTSSFNFSFNRNKIKSLYGDMIDIVNEAGEVIGQEEADDWTNGWFVGESIDRVWDYEKVGIWQENEVDEAAIYGKNPGDIKLKDQNGDGNLTAADDKVFLGYKTPQYRFGMRNDLNYKNFTFSTYFRADQGFMGSNSTYLDMGWIDRRNILYAPYWTSDNPSNEYPKLDANVGSPTFKVWKDRSFIRLQDVTLSYSIPRDILKNSKIDNLKFSLNLRNYFTITKWNHWDPESGTNPMPKYITFGVNLTL